MNFNVKSKVVTLTIGTSLMKRTNTCIWFIRRNRKCNLRLAIYDQFIETVAWNLEIGPSSSSTGSNALKGRLVVVVDKFKYVIRL